MTVNNQGGEGQTLGPTHLRSPVHRHARVRGRGHVGAQQPHLQIRRGGQTGRLQRRQHTGRAGAIYVRQWSYGHAVTWGPDGCGRGLDRRRLRQLPAGPGDHSNVNAPRDTQMRNMVWSAYAQDNWKFSRKLTLTYGLRWDFTPMAHELNNQRGRDRHHHSESVGGRPAGRIHFRGLTVRGAAIASLRSRTRTASDRAWEWPIRLNDKTVVRAGWGLTYSSGDSWGYLNGGMPVAGLGFNSVTASTGYGYAVSNLQNGIQYDPVGVVRAHAESRCGAWTGFAGSGAGMGRAVHGSGWREALARQPVEYRAAAATHPNMTIEAAYVGNRGVWEQARGCWRSTPSHRRGCRLWVWISPTRRRGACSRLRSAPRRRLTRDTNCRTRVTPARPTWRSLCGPSPSTPTACPPGSRRWAIAGMTPFRSSSSGTSRTGWMSLRASAYQKEQCLGSNGCAGINDASTAARTRGSIPLPRHSSG